MFPHQSRCQRDWNHPRHHDHCPTHHLAWRKDAWSITASDNFTLQGTNISHLGKRKIIFKSALVGDMLVSGRVNVWGDLLWEFQLDMMISCPRPFLDSGENDTYSTPLKINMDAGAQKLENKHGLWNSRIYWGILGSGVWEPSQIHAWQGW